MPYEHFVSYLDSVYSLHVQVADWLVVGVYVNDTMSHDFYQPVALEIYKLKA